MANRSRAFENIPAVGDYDGDGTVTTAFEEIGTIALVTDPTATAPTPTNGGTGLFGQLNLQLAKQGIFYNPDKNPYFFTSTSLRDELYGLDYQHPFGRI